MTLFINKGDAPLTDSQLERRTQAYIDRDWPRWQRERSIRKQDGQFNAYMDQVEVDTDVNRENNTFNGQLKEYTRAVTRLDQYELSVGREEITEELETGEYDEQTGEPITETVVVSEAIEPLPREVEVTQTVVDSDGEPVLDSDGEVVTETVMVRNPEIVRDEEERARATEVVDSTPPEVIKFHEDSIE